MDGDREGTEPEDPDHRLALGRASAAAQGWRERLAHLLPHEIPWRPLLVASLIAVGVWIRLAMFGFEGNDIKYFMGPWYDYIASHGGFKALGDRFSDYTPPYLYLLAVGASLPIRRVYAIKLVSAVFDFVLAGFAALAVREKYRRSPLPLFAFLAVLFAPTVLVNSSLWGQNDAIYSSFLLLTVLFLLRDARAAAMLAFGVALAFKAQAVFLSPLLLAFLVRRRLWLRHFLIVPATYVALMVPAALAGRSVTDLLLIYPRQAGEYPHLTMGAPNLYQWLPDNWQLFHVAGILLAAAGVLAVGLLAVQGTAPLDAEGTVRLALLSTMLVPLLLPGMHERYFFPADVLAIVFAFYFPRLFAVPVVVGLVSLFAYVPFLLGKTVVPLELLAAVMAGVAVFLAADWIRTLELGRPCQPADRA